MQGCESSSSFCLDRLVNITLRCIDNDLRLSPSSARGCPSFLDQLERVTARGYVPSDGKFLLPFCCSISLFRQVPITLEIPSFCPRTKSVHQPLVISTSLRALSTTRDKASSPHFPEASITFEASRIAVSFPAYLLFLHLLRPYAH